MLCMRITCTIITYLCLLIIMLPNSIERNQLKQIATGVNDYYVRPRYRNCHVLPCVPVDVYTMRNMNVLNNRFMKEWKF